MKFEVVGVLDNNSYTPARTEPRKNTNFKGEIKMLNVNILKKNDIELIHKDEVFERVPDWTRYYISNYGRLLHRNNDNTYNLVQGCINNCGYCVYTMCQPGRKYKGKKVHRDDGSTTAKQTAKTAQELVATVFCDNPYPPEYTRKHLQIHHKNRHRADNRASNLMWLSKRDHKYIHTIKKIALYNENTTQYRTYRDIETLCNHIDVTVPVLIENLKYNEIQIQNGKWTTYQINGCYVGVQYCHD